MLQQMHAPSITPTQQRMLAALRHFAFTPPFPLPRPQNMLVCAPTGAGKTNVAMLTILHEIGLHRWGRGTAAAGWPCSRLFSRQCVGVAAVGAACLFWLAQAGTGCSHPAARTPAPPAHRREDGSIDTSAFKIIYVAPMKVSLQLTSCVQAVSLGCCTSPFEAPICCVDCGCWSVLTSLRTPALPALPQALVAEMVGNFSKRLEPYGVKVGVRAFA